ncbi:hypothetical protein PRIPAC_72119, partial [Pristionchus pacificus]
TFTTTRVLTVLVLSWILCVCTSFGLYYDPYLFDKISTYINVASLIFTVSFYFGTIVYLKMIKSEFRRSIPSSIIRTALSSFLLCSVDIGSYCLWLLVEYALSRD